MDTTLELRRRRLFAGISMITAPLAIGIAFLVAPQLTEDIPGRLTAWAAAPGRVEVALIIGVVGIAFAVFAALGLGHLLREEQSWFGQIGSLLAVAGMVAFTVALGGVVAATEAAQLDVASAAFVYDAASSNPVMYLAMGGLVATGIGFLVLAAGLVLARTAPMFTSYGLAIGMVIAAIGIALVSTPWIVGAALVTFVALAPLGYDVIAEPDEEWAHPAHFQGMHLTHG